MGFVEFDGPHGETVMAHMQCPFRIVNDGKILVGSADMLYLQKSAGERTFDEFRTVFDAPVTALNGILGQLRPSVEAWPWVTRGSSP